MAVADSKSNMDMMIFCIDNELFVLMVKLLAIFLNIVGLALGRKSRIIS